VNAGTTKLPIQPLGCGILDGSIHTEHSTANGVLRWREDAVGALTGGAGRRGCGICGPDSKGRVALQHRHDAVGEQAHVK